MSSGNFRTMTKPIGDELARVIRESAVVQTDVGTLKVCQFGGIEQLAAPMRLGELLPCVFVEPFPKAVYEHLDMAGSESDVRESYRIALFYKVAAKDDLQLKQHTNVSALLTALRQNSTLSDGLPYSLTRPDQVTWSGLEAIDWAPPEALFLTDNDMPAQVVVLEWTVRWLNRG